jgi:hypothetical protein
MLVLPTTETRKTEAGEGIEGGRWGGEFIKKV